MKWVAFLSAGLLLASVACGAEESFAEWLKKDREDLKSFVEGKPPASEAEQRTLLQVEVEKALAAISEAGQSRGLTDWQFVVSVYGQIMGADPTALEIQSLAQLLLGDRDRSCLVQIDRSKLVALLIAKKEEMLPLNYATVKRNLALLQSLQVKAVPGKQPQPPEFIAEEPRERAHTPSVLVNDGTYNLYRGYMHAHTSLSDGQGSPEDAYKMARDEGGLDFFAVTDHAVYLPVWPWENTYGKIKSAAEAANEPGAFVALPGFEWSSPVYGHINVIGAAGYTTCVDSFDLSDIYAWIAKHPATIATLNHPGRLNTVDMQFEHFKFYEVAADQIVGIEMFNSDEPITVFFDTGFTEGGRYLDEAMVRGWLIGVVGGQDNHKRNWGVWNDRVVGVWAESLTREGIVDAYRKRRTFAVEDRNLSLSLKIDGAEMGSRLKSGIRQVTITVSDDADDAFSSARLYKNGGVLNEWTDLGNRESLTYSINAAKGDIYYALVVQRDGNQALSSPIWIVE